MKKTITKQQQSYINNLLRKRKEKQIEKAMTVHQQRDRLWMYDEENYIHKDGTIALESQIENFKRLK